MKKVNVLLALTALVTSAAALADTLALPVGSMGLRPVENMKIIKVEDGCPRGARCLMASTKVTAQATLGCTSALSPVGYSLHLFSDGEREAVTIQYTAFEITNQAARVVRCFAPNYVNVVFRVNGELLEEGQISLESSPIVTP